MADRTIIPPGCRIAGDVCAAGDVHVGGEVTGVIAAPGTVEVGDTAVVRGGLIAGAARLAGRVEGDVLAERGVALLAGAVVTGRVFAGRLISADGATLAAEVRIGADAVRAAPVELRRRMTWRNDDVADEPSDATLDEGDERDVAGDNGALTEAENATTDEYDAPAHPFAAPTTTTALNESIEPSIPAATPSIHTSPAPAILRRRRATDSSPPRPLPLRVTA